MLEALLSGNSKPLLEFQNYTWRELGTLRYGFHHDIAKWNEQFHWIGGYLSGPQAAFMRWDGANWTSLVNIPTPRAGQISAVVGDKLYVCGGLNANGSDQTNLVQCYDFLLGTWSTKASMPGTQAFGDGCVVGTDIYLFGGMTSQSVTPESPSKFIQYKYDTLTDTWSELSIVGQTPRLDLGVAALGTKIYLVGGRYNSAYTNKTFCYDTVTGEITQKANLLAAYGCRRSLLAFEGRLISLWGSATVSSPYAGTNYYNPDTNTWHSLSILPGVARGFGGAGFVGKRLFYFGGIKGTLGQSDTWEFRPPA